MYLFLALSEVERVHIMVKACLNCKRLFDDYFDTNTLCESCRKEEESLLRKVKDYLWDNPGTTEKKLNELFGVSKEQVKMWLRQGRLELTPDSKIKLTCLRCGSMIKTGKYCKECIVVLKEGFNTPQKGTLVQDTMVMDRNASNKMRFLDK